MGKSFRARDQDRETVIRMIADGKSRTEIARRLKISISSLRRHFHDVLNHKPGGTPTQFSDREGAMVELAARYSTPAGEMAKALGVSHSTFIKYFGELMKASPTGASALVEGSVLRMATRGENINAAKYYLNNRDPSRWGEKLSVEGRMAVSAQVQIEHTDGLLDLGRQLSPAGREALRVVLLELDEAKAAQSAIPVEAA